jgi:hypothetical protein
MKRASDTFWMVVWMGTKITLKVVEKRDILKSRMKKWAGHVA